MSPGKTITQRVQKLRKNRTALGLKRHDIYAHDEDWPVLKAHAAELAAKRHHKTSAKSVTVQKVLA